MVWKHEIQISIIILFLCITGIKAQPRTTGRNSPLCTIQSDNRDGKVDVDIGGNISLPCATGKELPEDFILKWRMGTGDTVVSFSIADGELPGLSRRGVLKTNKRTNFTLQIITIEAIDLGQYLCEVYSDSGIFCELLRVSIRVRSTTPASLPPSSSEMVSKLTGTIRSRHSTSPPWQSTEPSTHRASSITNTIARGKALHERDGGGFHSTAYKVFTTLLPSSLAGSVLVGSGLLIFVGRKCRRQSTWSRGNAEE